MKTLLHLWQSDTRKNNFSRLFPPSSIFHLHKSLCKMITSSSMAPKTNLAHLFTVFSFKLMPFQPNVGRCTIARSQRFIDKIFYRFFVLSFSSYRRSSCSFFFFLVWPTKAALSVLDNAVNLKSIFVSFSSSKFISLDVISIKDSNYMMIGSTSSNLCNQHTHLVARLSRCWQKTREIISETSCRAYIKSPQKKTFT